MTRVVTPHLLCWPQPPINPFFFRFLFVPSLSQIPLSSLSLSFFLSFFIPSFYYLMNSPSLPSFRTASLPHLSVSLCPYSLLSCFVFICTEPNSPHSLFSSFTSFPLLLLSFLLLLSLSLSHSPSLILLPLILILLTPLLLFLVLLHLPLLPPFLPSFFLQLFFPFFSYNTLKFRSSSFHPWYPFYFNCKTHLLLFVSLCNQLYLEFCIQ